MFSALSADTYANRHIRKHVYCATDLWTGRGLKFTLETEWMTPEMATTKNLELRTLNWDFKEISLSLSFKVRLTFTLLSRAALHDTRSTFTLHRLTYPGSRGSASREYLFVIFVRSPYWPKSCHQLSTPSCLFPWRDLTLCLNPPPCFLWTGGPIKDETVNYAEAMRHRGQREEAIYHAVFTDKSIAQT